MVLGSGGPVLGTGGTATNTLHLVPPSGACNCAWRLPGLWRRECRPGSSVYDTGGHREPLGEVTPRPEGLGQPSRTPGKLS